LALWLLLVLMLLATYRIVGERPPSAAPGPMPLRRGEPLGWLIPLAVYLAMGVRLLVLRAQLPAQYRTGELRQLPAPKAQDPEPSPAPAPIDLRWSGSDGSRPVVLRADERGLLWQAEGRLLQPALELRVSWSELEAISTARTWSSLATWGLVLLIVALILATTHLVAGAGCALLGAALVLLGRRRSRGTLSFVTSTHALTFHSRQLDVAAQDHLMRAARERAPRAVAPVAENRGVLRVLVVEPFVSFARACRSNEWVQAAMLREGASFPDPESARASSVQVRMYGIWSGVMLGVGPIAVTLGAAIAQGGPLWGVAPGLLGWVFGLVVVTRAVALFARFSGMSLVR
jgi:hypothetical protein